MSRALLIVSLLSIILSHKLLGQKSNNYYGYEVRDNYEHLEDSTNKVVKNWILQKEQEALSFLDSIPNRVRLFELQKELEAKRKNLVKNTKITEDLDLFFLKKKSGESYQKLYKRNHCDETEELIYDPINFDQVDSLSYYISYYKPSWNGKLVLIAFSKNGEDSAITRIYDISNKKFIGSAIQNSLPSIGGAYWLPSNEGVVFLKFPNPINDEDIYFNTEVVLYDVLKDTSTVKFSKKNNSNLDLKEEDIPHIYIDSSIDKYMYAAIGGVSSYHEYYIAPIEQINQKKQDWKLLFKKEDQVTNYIQDRDSIIYMSSKTASNFEIYKTSLSNPDLSNSKIIVAEKSNETINNFVLTKSGLFYTTTKNGVEAKVYMLDSSGNDTEIEIPNRAGNVSLYYINRKTNYFAINTRSWLHDSKRYIFDFNKMKFISADFKNSEDLLSPDNFIVEELEVLSHDGELIPLSLIYKKGLERNSMNPVYLYGYGAYGVSFKPRPTTRQYVWVKEGGIFAVAHVRGGREKGDSWYKGGFQDTKPNSWKDFIACTEYLINSKYTTSDKITASGDSAGAITAGRAFTDRPELYGAVSLEVGPLNMIKSEFGHNGKNNIKEFGTIATKEGFENLYKMDAFHHLRKDINYPAAFIISSLNDTRVPYWHSAKFAAKLQDYNASNNPVLLQIDTESGHGLDPSIDKKQKSVTDDLSFALWATGHPDYQFK